MPATNDLPRGAPAVTSGDSGPDSAIKAHHAYNGNLKLDTFDTKAKQIAFEGRYVPAQLEFQTKDGPGTMHLSYSLAKLDSTW